VILAGGKGTRLRPYTTSLPKPLVPIGDEHSILEIVLRQLAASRFTSATLAIGHLGQLVRAYVRDGSQWGIDVEYAEEDVPLGTIGPLLPILDRLPKNFLVMNGDVLTDLDYGALFERHLESGTPLTVAAYRRQISIDFGVLDLNATKIVGFVEKPTIEHHVSMGVYAMSRSALAAYPPGKSFGFDDLVLDLINEDRAPDFFPFDGYWRDIGRPEDYDAANDEFAARREALLPVWTPPLFSVADDASEEVA
jgi:NDP-sugar pyrophosphorylase family protein